MRYLTCALVGGVALCSVATIKALLKVLGKTFVMVLLYHSSDRGWFYVPARFVLRGSVVPYSVVKKTGLRSCDGEKGTSTRARKQALVA